MCVLLELSSQLIVGILETRQCQCLLLTVWVVKLCVDAVDGLNKSVWKA